RHTRSKRDWSSDVCSSDLIIVNYNGGSKLLECVDSVFRYTSDFELILVDNASTDNSLLPVAKRFPQVITVRNPENIGFAGGSNKIGRATCRERGERTGVGA